MLLFNEKIVYPLSQNKDGTSFKKNFASSHNHSRYLHMFEICSFQGTSFTLSNIINLGVVGFKLFASFTRVDFLYHNPLTLL